VERVNSALDQATAPRGRTPQALGQLVRTEIDKLVPLIEAAGVGGN